MIEGSRGDYSGPATFLLSLPSPPSGSIMLSQLSACSAFPVVAETANNTPNEFAAVDKKYDLESPNDKTCAARMSTI